MKKAKRPSKAVVSLQSSVVRSIGRQVFIHLIPYEGVTELIFLLTAEFAKETQSI